MMRKPHQPEAPSKPMIKLSVELTDGSFASFTQVSLDATKEEKEKAVDKWLAMVSFGFTLEGDVTITQRLGASE